MAFRPAEAHGKLDEVFPDVFHLTGTYRAGALMAFPRNMVVVRQGDELALINAVRLTAPGEAALDRLGKVKHVLRIGAFHGSDDPYYVDRYKASLWAPKRMTHKGPIVTDKELGPDTPIADSQVFLFERGKLPEAVILLKRAGGIIVTCDSFQNWTSFDGSSVLGKLALKMMKFGPAMIGPIWAKTMGPDVRSEFDTLIGLEFKHALSGHGAPVRDDAKEALRRAMLKLYGA